MNARIDHLELSKWLKDYFNREFLRLNPSQFKRFLELRGFSAKEQEYLINLYTMAIGTDYTKRVTL